VEARADGLSLRGRVVIAWMYNPRLVDHYAEFRPDPQYVALPVGGFTDGVLELSVADLAYDGSGTKWRYEERAVFLSGMPTGGWQASALRGQHAPREFYRYAVCDEEGTRQYERAKGMLSLWPSGEQARGFSWVQEARWGLLRTLWYNAPLSVNFGPGRADEIRYEGSQVQDALDCEVWASATPIEMGRSYRRVWVAPDLDFAVVREEHVNVREDGTPLYASVTRWTKWEIAQGVPLSVPRRAQMDHADYSTSDAELVGPGWMFSRLLVADGIELSAEPLPAEALDVSVPFDTTVWDVPLELARQVDPVSAHNTAHFRELAEFLPPDPLLERIKTESPQEVLWGE